MEFWIKAAQLILSLSILIVLHELGHFLPAKYFKTRVEKFYLFFNPWFSLFKVKKGETEYGIGWLPLGGFVKISGMIDESMDTEQMSKPPQPWEFRSKPAWQRLIIMAGGVTVNIFLGAFIYMMVLFVWGKDYIPPENIKEHGMYVHESFEKYGFQQGDIILEKNGEAITDVTDINGDMFLRGINEIKVKHPNGEEAVIKMPEDIGSIMFESGVMQPLQPRFYAVIDSVIEDHPAIDAGFSKGDSVVAINDTAIIYWQEMSDFTHARTNTELKFSIYRNGELLAINVKTTEEGTIGIAPKALMKNFKIEHKDYGFFESIPAGFSKGYRSLNDYVSQFKYVFTKKGASQIGGFGSIGSIFPSTWEWQRFWELTAFLSIMLAFMNILPIPALDGGHILFLLYEMISGRAPSQKFLEYAQMAGIVLLLGLMLYANGNDIYKWIAG